MCVGRSSMHVSLCCALQAGSSVDKLSSFEHAWTPSSKWPTDPGSIHCVRRAGSAQTATHAPTPTASTSTGCTRCASAPRCAGAAQAAHAITASSHMQLQSCATRQPAPWCPSCLQRGLQCGVLQSQDSLAPAGPALREAAALPAHARASALVAAPTATGQEAQNAVVAFITCPSPPRAVSLLWPQAVSVLHCAARQGRSCTAHISHCMPRRTSSRSTRRSGSRHSPATIRRCGSQVTARCSSSRISTPSRVRHCLPS